MKNKQITGNVSRGKRGNYKDLGVFPRAIKKKTEGFKVKDSQLTVRNEAIDGHTIDQASRPSLY